MVNRSDHIAAYSCTGSRRLGVEDFTHPDVKLDYFQGTSGTYAGLDRFGRVRDQKWQRGCVADIEHYHMRSTGKRLASTRKSSL